MRTGCKIHSRQMSSSLTLNERILAALDELWVTVMTLNLSTYEPICQIIGRALIMQQSNKTSESKLAELLQLHTKDINKHCNLLRLHGLILGEETKEKAAAEELSAKSAVLEAAGLTAANVQTGKRSQHYRPPAVTYRYWIEPGRFVKVLKYRYLRMLATLEQRAAARDQNSYYRCSASSVEQCTDVARLISQFDISKYLDMTTHRVVCPRCQRDLQPNVSAEAEATAREISELKSRLNAQFSPALKLIQQLEELLKQQQAGLAEKEIERQKEIVAVKEGRKVVSQPTAALPSSSRVSVTAVASTPTPQFHQATVAAPKAALPFLPQARQQIGAASSAQHDQAIAKPTAPEPVVKSVVPTISQEEHNRLVESFAASARAEEQLQQQQSSSSGPLLVSVAGVLKPIDQVTEEDFTDAMTLEEQEAYTSLSEQM